jgi:general secretion pathway protein I
MKARGFTLIEVLLALVVFALAFGLILETLGGASRIVRVAGDVGYAALLAQNQLDQVGTTEPLKDGIKTGKFDDNYSYRLETKKIVPEDSSVPKSAAQLYLVTMKVSWGSGGQARTETFSTLRVEFPPGQRY